MYVHRFLLTSFSLFTWPKYECKEISVKTNIKIYANRYKQLQTFGCKLSVCVFFLLKTSLVTAEWGGAVWWV